LHQIESLRRDDSGVAVFHIILRNLTLVDLHFFREKIHAESLLSNDGNIDTISCSLSSYKRVHLMGASFHDKYNLHLTQLLSILITQYLMLAKNSAAMPVTTCNIGNSRIRNAIKPIKNVLDILDISMMDAAFLESYFAEI
jgi:hypothetical protein